MEVLVGFGLVMGFITICYLLGKLYVFLFPEDYYDDPPMIIGIFIIIFSGFAWFIFHMIGSVVLHFIN